MIRKWEIAVILSDAHAGGGGKADDLTRWSWLLQELLEECVRTETATVFAGDIRELWQFRPAEILKVHGQTFRPVRTLIELGKFHDVPGNHDIESGAAVSIPGLGWSSESLVIDTGRGRFFIEHGHRWDRHNRKPGWRHRLLLAVVKRLEGVFPNIDVLDNYKRSADRRKPKDPLQDPLALGAKRILNSGHYSGVVMGHTHRSGLWWIPTISPYPRRPDFKEGPLPYANCGAWTNARTPSVVVVRGGSLEVVTIESRKDFREIWK